MNIFTLRSVEFDHQKEDPFGFDSAATNIADRYLSFSGVIRKPIYLVFVAYINELLKNNDLKYQLKRVNDVKIRLEKLLVLSWRRKDAIRGKSIIGSSIKNINPFEARDGNWVVQNCFKIYEASSRKLDLNNVVGYCIRYNKPEIKLLNEFLSRSGPLNKNEKYLHNLLLKLSKRKSSLFNGNTILSPKLRTMFMKSLKKSVNELQFNNDKQFLEKIFSTPQKSGVQIEKVLISTKYPFKYFNNWVRNFVLSVDLDLNDEDSTLAWKRTDSAKDELKNSHIYQRRPKPNCWFKFINDKYVRADDFDEAGWEAMLRRARRKDGKFYDFKLTALHSLLKEAAGNE